MLLGINKTATEHPTVAMASKQLNIKKWKDFLQYKGPEKQIFITDLPFFRVCSNS